MALSIRSEIEPIDPRQVPLFVAETIIEQSFQVATVTVLVYDTIITMDKEIRYFWGAERKVVNIVYFVNRYVGLLGAASALFLYTYKANLPLCNFTTWTHQIANWITVILIDYILMIRVLALYSQDKILSVCLKTLLILEAAFKLGVVIYLNKIENISVGGLARGVTICGLDDIAPLGWAYVDWIIPMVYGVLLMCLALYKAAEFWKLSVGFKGFTLVKVLVEDQLVYFMLVVACSVSSILQFKLAESNAVLSTILEALGSPSFLCVLGSRILVNLKEAGERGLNEGTSYRIRSRSVSEMVFV